MYISKYNSQITLDFILTKRENQYFERKGLGEKDIKPSKLANEIIGMLNADGGILVFGVSDSKEVQDLNNLHDKLSTYRNLISDFIEPSNHVRLEEVTIENKLIFLFHVEQDIERIFKRKDNEQIYLRVDDQNRLLNREAVRNLEYDKQIRKFEDEIEPEFDLKDLDLKLLNRYKEKLNYEGPALDLLVKRHLAIKKENRYLIKKAGILLFSTDPNKYIPSASLRYIRYEGIEAKVGLDHNVSKDIRFEGNIPRIIGKVKDFLNLALRDYYILDLDQGRFNEVPEYPQEAWLEGIVNALCHRSYNVQGNSIYIKHFENKIEISNSGPLPAQVTIDNIRTERYSRNPRIARSLEDMGFVRQLNEGVSRIFLVMEKSMLSEPEYDEKHGNVYLTLRNNISKHSKTISSQTLEIIHDEWENLNSSQKKILEFIFYHNQATIDGLVLEVGISTQNIRRNLNQLIEADVIEKISEKQRDINAKYTFKKH